MNVLLSGNEPFLEASGIWSILLVSSPALLRCGSTYRMEGLGGGRQLFALKQNSEAHSVVTDSPLDSLVTGQN